MAAQTRRVSYPPFTPVMTKLNYCCALTVWGALMQSVWYFNLTSLFPSCPPSSLFGIGQMEEGGSDSSLTDAGNAVRQYERVAEVETPRTAKTRDFYKELVSVANVAAST